MSNETGPYDALPETLSGLEGDGLLLVTGEQGNPMTIGWATIGPVWGLPIMTVLVRPSRYSFSLLERLPQFTVNVPRESQRRAVVLCGSRSGRDVDKIEECGFTLDASKSISVPSIGECAVHYECRVVSTVDLDPGALAPSVKARYYASEDIHRVFHGEILRVVRH